MILEVHPQVYMQVYSVPGLKDIWLNLQRPVIGCFIGASFKSLCINVKLNHLPLQLTCRIFS